MHWTYVPITEQQSYNSLPVIIIAVFRKAEGSNYSQVSK